MVEIEKKMATFSTDCRKSIEYKLEKIKRLYEGINTKKSHINNQEQQKDRLIKLIKEAEDNDQLIKDAINNKNGNLTRTELEASRKIKAMKKTLDDLADIFAKEINSMQNDQDKLETINQC